MHNILICKVLNFSTPLTLRYKIGGGAKPPPPHPAPGETWPDKEKCALYAKNVILE
jgi:hypothetical protein